MPILTHGPTIAKISGYWSTWTRTVPDMVKALHLILSSVGNLCASNCGYWFWMCHRHGFIVYDPFTWRERCALKWASRRRRWVWNPMKQLHGWETTLTGIIVIVLMFLWESVDTKKETTYRSYSNFNIPYTHCMWRQGLGACSGLPWRTTGL